MKRKPEPAQSANMPSSKVKTALAARGLSGEYISDNSVGTQEGRSYERFRLDTHHGG
jgi:hypothetical protein